MRAVLQRVLSASVEVEGEVVSRIGPGILCLMGLHAADQPGGEADARRLAKKIVGLRLWEDENGRPWQQSVVTRGYEILMVSQFTLYANCMKGKKPDFSKAMKTEAAAELYAYALHQVREECEREGLGADRVQDGVFGAMMKVALENDGPVTVMLDSPAPPLGGAPSGSGPPPPGKAGGGRGTGARGAARAASPPRQGAAAQAGAAATGRACSPSARARSPLHSRRG